MRRPILEAAVLGALLMIVAGADKPRTPSISAVMHKQYTVTNAPFTRIKKELNAATPDWAKVQEAARKFVTLAEALPKNEPLEGSRDSWKAQTDQHLSNARALESAAESRDKPALLAVHQRLTASCKACHAAHRTRGAN